MPSISKENEAAAWKLISKVADEALAQYPTTLEEDVQILAKDNAEHSLAQNKRNCVLYRKMDKEVLYFLKDSAQKVAELMTMTAKDAKKEVNSWGNGQGLEYFKQCVCSMLL